MIEEGATEIRLLNRTLENAQALADEFGAAITPVAWNQRHDALAGAALLINTTSQGMHGQPELDLQLNDLPTSALVSDIIYIPVETTLLRRARERGNPGIHGLGMLIHQARPAFEAWFGVAPQASPELYKKVLSSL